MPRACPPAQRRRTPKRSRGRRACIVPAPPRILAPHPRFPTASRARMAPCFVARAISNGLALVAPRRPCRSRIATNAKAQRCCEYHSNALMLILQRLNANTYKIDYQRQHINIKSNDLNIILTYDVTTAFHSNVLMLMLTNSKVLMVTLTLVARRRRRSRDDDRKTLH